jgi:uncharacterized damage-inducible protein DinB
MNKEMQAIIQNLQDTLSGEPWYGKPVYILMDGVDVRQIAIRPNNKAHSLIEILDHMIYWAEFVLNSVNANSPTEGFEDKDWSTIYPSEESWQKGVLAFKNIHRQIIDCLQTKEDAFLKEMVAGRKYNIRFLLNGLIQHNIYHAGQIAYIARLLES